MPPTAATPGSARRPGPQLALQQLALDLERDQHEEQHH
jgi:hypothetical protein